MKYWLLALCAMSSSAAPIITAQSTCNVISERTNTILAVNIGTFNCAASIKGSGAFVESAVSLTIHQATLQIAFSTGEEQQPADDPETFESLSTSTEASTRFSGQAYSTGPERPGVAVFSLVNQGTFGNNPSAQDSFLSLGFGGVNCSVPIQQPQFPCILQIGNGPLVLGNGFDGRAMVTLGLPLEISGGTNVNGFGRANGEDFGRLTSAGMTASIQFYEADGVTPVRISLDPVPEPGTIAITLLGLLGLALPRWRLVRQRQHGLNLRP